MKLIPSVLIYFVLLAVINGQNSSNEKLNSMISTEYEFAARALQVGSRDAFLDFIADEGILFRPTPVNGKEFLLKQNPRPGFLIWYPSYAFISKSGEMGCTAGPAEFKGNPDSSSIWYGNFCTVWQIQKNGQWKFLIDGGISNNKPENEIKKLKYDPEKNVNSPVEFYSGSLPGKELIFSVDENFNSTLLNGDFTASYSNVINEETRLLREGEYPIIGKSDIIKYVSGYKGKFRFEITDGKISNAGDFGYVYGLLNISDSKQSGKFNYLRMWRNDYDHWKIVIELFSPLPE